MEEARAARELELEFHQLDLRYEGLRVRRPERERRLLASLAERGQQVPIVVISLPGQAGRFLVIDGYKRIRALRRLKRDTVRATRWDMDETEALILDRTLRSAEGETALEQGWLLRELQAGAGLGLEELAGRFDRSLSWVSRRLALVTDLPASVQEQVRLGRIGAHAAMKHLVPLARANRHDCERLAREIAHHRFTTREVELLCTTWRNEPYLRERVVTAPKLFLRVRRELEEEEPVAVRAGEELLRHLDLIGLMARRAARQWREAARALDISGRDNAWLCVEQAIDDLKKLSDEIQKEHDDVEAGPTDGDSGAAQPESGHTAHGSTARPVAHRGQAGHRVRLVPPAAAAAARESRAVSARHSGTVLGVPGEPGPSP
jgi:ParB family chromosome partitioning protein